MTTRRRITTAVLVSLGFAISATPAMAYPTDLTPNGSEVPAGSPSALSQAPVPTTPPTIVRVSPSSGAFDWGDAGIGAAGGLALAMIGLGGALVVSQRRPRRNRQTTPLS